MANYDVTQLTEDYYCCDLSFPLNIRPSISADGQRVVYAAKLEPGRPGYVIWLYQNGEPPRQLRVNTRGEEKVLFHLSLRPQISADGRFIVFRAPAYYTEEDETGIYLYDIERESIRLLIKDQIPRYPNGARRNGEPGMRKYETSKPSLSADGRWLSYIWTDFEFRGSTRDHWGVVRQRLMLADVGGDRIRGGAVVEILSENAFGHGFQSQRISADGSTVAFYAGGVVDGVPISNLDMPEFEMNRRDEYSGYTCDVYCYVVTMLGVGDYRMQVVPRVEDASRPLVVAHPDTASVQSFRSGSVLDNPPSLSANGQRIALNGEFVMRSRDTGIYVFERSGETHSIIRFGAVPGADPEEPMLTTGAVPSLSPDGRWLAYYAREVSFRLGYGDPEEYEEGETYCPSVQSDDVVVCRLPSGERSRLLGAGAEMIQPAYTPAMGVALSDEAAHVAFISRSDRTHGNPDFSHEVFYASLLPE